MAKNLVPITLYTLPEAPIMQVGESKNDAFPEPDACQLLPFPAVNTQDSAAEPDIMGRPAEDQSKILYSFVIRNILAPFQPTYHRMRRGEKFYPFHTT